MRRSRNAMAAGVAALVVAGLALAAGGCGGTGMGQAVRKDISARMASAQGPMSSCYHDALEKHRRLHGRVTVTFQAAAGTGKFTNVRVVQSQLRDAEMEACVVKAVTALALQKPQKTAVAVTYPIDFSPTP